MAKLYFRYGAMNSGKSTALLQVAHNYEEQGMNVIILKPIVDSKGEDNIVSRIGIERKVDHVIKADEDIYQLVKDNYDELNCIIVDEVQFLRKVQIDELMQIVTELDIPVICYGLRTDFQTKGFPAASRLLEIAHSIEEIKTICKCGSKAIFNARLIDGVYTFTGEQVKIDDDENHKKKVGYESMCPKCYYKVKKNGKR